MSGRFAYLALMFVRKASLSARQRLESDSEREQAQRLVAPQVAATIITKKRHLSDSNTRGPRPPARSDKSPALPLTTPDQ